jgi:hypothetical protein
MKILESHDFLYSCPGSLYVYSMISMKREQYHTCKGNALCGCHPCTDRFSMHCFVSSNFLVIIKTSYLKEESLLRFEVNCINR